MQWRDVLLRVLGLAVLLCLGNRAQAQVDTTRRPPVSVRVRAAAASPGDSVARSPDEAVETVQILRPGLNYFVMDSVKRRRLVDTFNAQRLKWERFRPRAYVIRVIDMTCVEITVRSQVARQPPVRDRPQVAGQPVRDQLVVRDTTIVRRVPVPIPRPYDQRCPLTWRVDDVFANLARALSDTTALGVTVEYDAVYGFPRSYSVFRGGSDDGREVLVESFAPAR